MQKLTNLFDHFSQTVERSSLCTQASNRTIQRDCHMLCCNTNIFPNLITYKA